MWNLKEESEQNETHRHQKQTDGCQRVGGTDEKGKNFQL